MSHRGPEPSDLPNPSARMRALGISPRKRFGQHFLLSGAVFRRLLDAAQVGPGDCVLEVGTGPGDTTRLIALRAGRVVAAEIDPDMASLTRDAVAGRDNVELLQIDALAGKSALAAPIVAALAAAAGQGMTLKLVANLPYSISAPLVVAALECPLGMAGIWVMVQKEVGRRLAAGPGSADYGPLSVFARLWSHVRILETVPPGAFWPPPEVTSCTVELRRRTDLRACIRDYAAFSSLVRFVFQGRRKLARNALKGLVLPETIPALFDRAGVAPDVRSDRVTLEELVRLANELAAVPS